MFDEHDFSSERTMKALRIFAVCFAAILALPFLARAQDTGYITGTVTDKSSAAVVDAQVTVANDARGIRQTVPTNSNGDYLVAGLPASTYTVSVTAKGFESFQESGIVLAAAEKRRVDVQLTVGSVSERVTVEGDAAPAVETQSSEVSDTITGKEVVQLELNGRNFTQLVTLAPGVSDQSGQDEGVVGVFGNVAYSINGGRTEYNNWEIDGVGDMDDGSATSLNVYPNADAIQEFQVLTSNYGAQYGKNGSGTVEVVTKSGTKDFHGDVFYFGRNDFFNARSFFDTDRPTYKKHDFGYTIGGPVYIPHHYNSDKSKTFFFFSEEWRREKNPTTFIQNVPSDDERSGNFSDLCPDSSGTFADCPTIPGSGGMFFPGNQVPVDSVNTSPLLALVPHANTTNGGYPAWQGSVSTPTLWREELFRIDHNLNSKNRLTFRYIHDSWNTVTPEVLNWSQQSSFPTIQTNFVGPATNFVTKLTTAASPTLLNEFIFGYTADHIFLTNTGPWQRPSTMTMTGLFDNGFGGKLPGFSVSNGTPYGGGLTNGGFTEDASFIPWNNANPIYTYRDNVTKIIRSHNLMFGATFIADQKNEINEPGFGTGGFLDFDATSPVSTGNAFADLLMGNIASYSQTNLQTKYYNRYKIFEPYLQDDWHIKKNLTLNLGLRVSMFGTYREKFQQEYNFNPPSYSAADAPLIDTDGSITGQPGALVPGVGSPFDGLIQCGGKGIPAGCLTGHLFNPAPRIGFAWDPFGNGKMAIRGGYGIFFEHTNGNEADAEALEGSPPLVLTPTQYNITGYTNIGGGGLLFPLAVTSIPSKAIWPYVQQWHLDIQKEIGWKTTLSVAYVGSKGTHLTTQRDINQLQPVPASQNPFTPGEPLSADICNSGMVNGVTVTGQAAINLSVACGNDADPYRPYYGLSDITRLQEDANSIYHSLQVEGTRTAGDLTFSAAYTYSHAIDDSSSRFDTGFVNSYDTASARASGNYDQRHILEISYVYDAPFFRHSSGIVHALLGGWEASGITTAETGIPFTVLDGDFVDNAGVANGTVLNSIGIGALVDQVGDPNASFQRNVPGVYAPLFYNPAAFTDPTGLTFGDSGRNNLRQPGRLNFDFGLFKRFEIHEQRSFEFRWENFNVFNHTQFEALDSTFGDATFLHPTTAHLGRIMQFGLKFLF
jgi:hypothetical protein